MNRFKDYWAKRKEHATRRKEHARIIRATQGIIDDRERIIREKVREARKKAREDKASARPLHTEKQLIAHAVEMHEWDLVKDQLQLEYPNASYSQLLSAWRMERMRHRSLNHKAGIGGGATYIVIGLLLSPLIIGIPIFILGVQILWKSGVHGDDI